MMATIPTFEQLEQAVMLSGNIAEELEAHASLLYHVGVGSARASGEADAQDYALTVKEADLQERIRKEAAASAEKVTEALITARIKSHPEYRAAFELKLQADLTAQEWKALLKAYDARGLALHNLTTLSSRTDMSGITGYEKLRQNAATGRRPWR